MGLNLRKRFECPICGTFEVTGITRAFLKSVSPEKRWLAGLSAYIRAANKLDEVPPFISTTDFEALAETHLNTAVNMRHSSSQKIPVTILR